MSGTAPWGEPPSTSLPRLTKAIKGEGSRAGTTNKRKSTEEPWGGPGEQSLSPPSLPPQMDAHSTEHLTRPPPRVQGEDSKGHLWGSWEGRRGLGGKRGGTQARPGAHRHCGTDVHLPDPTNALPEDVSAGKLREGAVGTLNYCKTTVKGHSLDVVQTPPMSSK